MHLDHVALQVHLSSEHDKFLVKASALCARIVFLQEMSFLPGKLVNCTNGSVAGTNQCSVVPEAE